jgi:hypothetical protein
LLAIVIAALAVVLVARGDSSVHVHMLIATALGVGMTVLIGNGLDDARLPELVERPRRAGAAEPSGE